MEKKRKKHRKITIRKFIFISMLAVILPGNLITILVCGSILQETNKERYTAMQESLDQFAAQIEIRLEMAQEYILQQMDDTYELQTGGGIGNLKYELAKSRMKNRFEGQINGAYADANIMDGIFAYIKETGQIVEARKQRVITVEEVEVLRTWIRTAEPSNWTIIDDGKEQYLTMKITNTAVSIGAAVKLDSIYREWRENSETECSIVTADQSLLEKESLQLLSQFQNSDLAILAYVKEKAWTRAVPALFQILFVLLLLLGMLTLLVFTISRRLLVTPLDRMKNTLLQIRNGDSEGRLSGCDTVQELMVIQTSFNEMMDQICNLKIQAYEMEIENQKINLTNLQMQMNPHLLLNSMNTIYSLAEIQDYWSLKKFTMYLVRYFRYSLNQIDKLVTVREELQFVENYVGIQKIRYPEKFIFLYHAEEDVMGEQIPPLIIENFVENSIKYTRRERNTEIMVCIRKERGRLIISVCDNGGGMDPNTLNMIQEEKPIERVDGMHIGIWNCRRRLALVYGEQVRFTVSSLDGGTQVYMEIPCSEEIENDFADCGR